MTVAAMSPTSDAGSSLVIGLAVTHALHDLRPCTESFQSPVHRLGGLVVGVFLENVLDDVPNLLES